MSAVDTPQVQRHCWEREAQSVLPRKQVHSSSLRRRGPPKYTEWMTRPRTVLCAALCIACTSLLAQASLSVPLAPQQVMALPPPGNATYDPPLPPGTATQDVTWVSYLPPEGPVVSLHGGSGELPLLIGGNVSLLAANASVQRDEWLRVDVLLGNVSLGGAVPGVHWTSPGGISLGGLQLPRVRLGSLGDAFACVLVLPGLGNGTSGAACSAVVHCFSGSCGSMGGNSTFPTWAAPLSPGQALLTLHAGLTVSVSGRRSGALRGHVEGGQYVRIAAGLEHACAIAAGGSLWCWGAGTDGALGNGNTVNAASPARVIEDPWYDAGSQQHLSVTHVDCGLHFTYAILHDGSLWCWGRGGLGQLAQGSAADLYRPARVTTAPWSSGPGQLRAVQIQCGGVFACALLEDGSVWCWGDGRRGRLGTGGSSTLTPPVQVNSVAWGSNHTQQKVLAISCGTDHSCALLEDGSLWCWGDGSDWRLGNGNTATQAVPISVRSNLWGTGDGRARLKQMLAGDRHTCAVPEDGSLWCWGDGTQGLLGIGTTGDHANPRRTMPSGWGSGPGEVQVVRLTAGMASQCAVLEDGSLWCWGQAGLIGQASGSRSLVPVRVNTDIWGSDPGKVSIVDAVSMGFFTCAVTADSQAHCWGLGGAGQLGNGGFDDHNTTQPVPSAHYAVHVPGARNDHLLKTFALSIAGPVRPVAPPCLLLPVPPALDAVTVGSAAPGCAQPNAIQAWSDILSEMTPAAHGKWLSHPALAAPFRTLSSHLQQASNGSLGNHSDVYIAAVRSCSDGGGGQAWETHQYMVSLGDGGLRVADGGQCSVGLGCGGWSLAAGLCLGGASCGVAGPVGGAAGSVNASALLYVPVAATV